MGTNGIDRRGFLQAAGVAGAGAATGLTGVGRARAAVGGDSPASGKGARNFYPFHTQPASAISFGLTPEQDQHARELHDSLYVFDGLAETTWFGALYDNMLKGGGAGVGGSFTLGAMGLESAQWRTENLLINRSDWWARHTLNRDLAFMSRQERENGDKMMLCRNAADLKKAQAVGKVGVMLDVQNTAFIGNDADLLEPYKQAGISRVQLTYNRTERAGTGCMEPRDGGLTLFGGEVVERLNELGMLVDTGHCSPLTLMDAVDASSKPIACSHAGLRSVAPTIRRTQPDEALKKLADHGGVFGVVSYPPTLTNKARCTVADYVDNIAIAVNLMGIDHVGFAMDYVTGASLQEVLSAPEWSPKAARNVQVSLWPWSDGHLGLENHTGYPNLTRGLVAKGYPDEDIRKIMGGNFIRLMRDTVG